MNTKTNAIRLLEQKNISFIIHDYLESGAISAVEVAEALGEDPARLFKTLLTKAKSGTYYVFMVPGDGSLDLKKAARAVGEKSLQMLKNQELFPLTGYVHGGCSPIGMKKRFPTVIHHTARNYDTIFISAGALGLQLEISVDELQKAVSLDFYDLRVYPF